MRQQGFRRAALAGGIVAAAAAFAPVGTQAMTPPPGWTSYDRATELPVPAGVTAMEVVAVGGNGGGANGGVGAVVHATLPLSAGQLVGIRPGAHGGVGAGDPAAGVIPAGRGGSASWVTLCTGERRCPLGPGSLLAAAGGGGSGAGSAGFPGGPGGAAGHPGADGTLLGDGLAARGGGAGTASAGGAGGAGAELSAGCVAGAHRAGGRNGILVLGGFGAETSDPARAGGSGGMGLYGGGGGGGAATCEGQPTGTSAGGGGGASLVPAGGTLTLSDPAATPHVRLAFVWERTAPTVMVESPTDGASYVRGAAVKARYACADEEGGSGIASCAGPVASGAALDTTTAGPHTFSVTARDNAGNETVRTIRYRVVEPTPVVRRLTATRTAFRFALSAPARVTVVVERRAAGRRARWVRVGTIRRAGRRGVNTIAHRSRIGKRVLAPGRYRVTVRATAAGRRSKAVQRQFAIRARR